MNKTDIDLAVGAYVKSLRRSANELDACAAAAAPDDLERVVECQSLADAYRDAAGDLERILSGRLGLDAIEADVNLTGGESS